MSVIAGVREFRNDLADYIDQSEPVTVTRHGQTVGLFIPVHRDHRADVEAYVEAAGKANRLLIDMGMTEDEAVAEFQSLREAEHSAIRAHGSSPHRS